MKEIRAEVSVRPSKRCLYSRTFVEFADFCECGRIVHSQNMNVLKLLLKPLARSQSSLMFN